MSVQDPRCLAEPALEETTDEAGTRGLEARFHVAVPPDVLLEILWDVNNFSRLFPEIKEFRVEDRSEDKIDVAYRIDAVLKELRYVLRRRVDRRACRITWHELSGDLRKIRGGWQIEATDVPEVSRAVYRAFVDVGRFVPSRLVAKTAKRKAREMVARVRQVAVDLYSTRIGSTTD